MIWLTYAPARLAGQSAGIYGFAADNVNPSRRGRFKLFAESGAGDDGDPVFEGDSAVELEQAAKRAGAVEVTHWYEAT